MWKEFLERISGHLFLSATVFDFKIGVRYETEKKSGAVPVNSDVPKGRKWFQVTTVKRQAQWGVFYVWFKTVEKWESWSVLWLFHNCFECFLKVTAAVFDNRDEGGFLNGCVPFYNGVVCVAPI